MIIAVDFDGTIVEHRYPEIGKEIPFAIDTLKMLQKEGHRLILWSVREDELLNEAVEFCRQRGLEFYAVNTNYPEEQTGHQYFSRKRLSTRSLTSHTTRSPSHTTSWRSLSKRENFLSRK
mgnify:CR=1 FL=1